MIIKTSKPKSIWKANTTLGEGTLWVPSHKSIYFVDIKKKNILSLNTISKKKKIFKLDKEIGFIVHIKSNIFLLGLKSEIRIVNLKNLICQLRSLFQKLYRPRRSTCHLLMGVKHIISCFLTQ